MTRIHSALPRSRAVQIFILGFCVYEALPQSMTSLRSTYDFRTQDRNAVLILGLMFVTYFLAFIAVKLSLVRERVVFGAAAIGTCLRVLIHLIAPSVTVKTVINGVVSLAWTVAAVCVLLSLVSRWGQGTES